MLRPRAVALARAAARGAAAALAPAPRRAQTAPPDSFFARARAAGANALLGALLTSRGRFDACLGGLEVLTIGDGRVACALTVTEALSNSYGTLHGGATATLVDVVGTLAALSVDPLRPGVSVEMNQSFVRAAKVGEVLRIEGRCLKAGARLAFTEVDILNARGEIVATGRHTKAL